MKWEVQIDGDKHVLKEIVKSLQDDALKIIEREDRYYLKLTSFDNINTSEEVRAEALKILPVLTGAIIISLGGIEPLKLLDVTRVNDNGIRDIFLFVEDGIAINDNVALEIQKENGKIESINSADNLPTLMKLSFSDPEVEKVYRILGSQKHDWVCLYRIYEIIEHDIGGINKIIQQGWAKKKTIELFKHTANSPKAVGDISRHGKESTLPPSNPMGLEEAKSFIKTLLKKWVTSK